MLDTHVWLDLLHFEDPRVDRLRDALRSQAVVALMDPRMRDELKRVLGYPAFALSATRRSEIAAQVAALSTPVDPPLLLHPVPRCRDPDDQMFVEVAIACRATTLLSRDDALLRLASRMRAHGVDVATPAAWCAARAAG